MVEYLNYIIEECVSLITELAEVDLEGVY